MNITNRVRVAAAGVKTKGQSMFPFWKQHYMHATNKALRRAQLGMDFDAPVTEAEENMLYLQTHGRNIGLDEIDVRLSAMFPAIAEEGDYVPASDYYDRGYEEDKYDQEYQHFLREKQLHAQCAAVGGPGKLYTERGSWVPSAERGSWVPSADGEFRNYRYDTDAMGICLVVQSDYDEMMYPQTVGLIYRSECGFEWVVEFDSPRAVSIAHKDRWSYRFPLMEHSPESLVQWATMLIRMGELDNPPAVDAYE